MFRDFYPVAAPAAEKDCGMCISFGELVVVSYATLLLLEVWVYWNVPHLQGIFGAKIFE